MTDMASGESYPCMKCGHLLGSKDCNCYGRQVGGVEFITIDVPDVWVTITAPVTKLCPIKNEVDTGTVRIWYRTNGRSFELHDLADYLLTFENRKLSHEAFTAEVGKDLDCEVSSSWTTAGMHVTINALLR